VLFTRPIRLQPCEVPRQQAASEIFCPKPTALLSKSHNPPNGTRAADCGGRRSSHHRRLHHARHARSGGDKYSLPREVDYVSNNEQVIITCRDHGISATTATHIDRFLRGLLKWHGNRGKLIWPPSIEEAPRSTDGKFLIIPRLLLILSTQRSQIICPIHGRFPRRPRTICRSRVPPIARFPAG